MPVLLVLYDIENEQRRSKIESLLQRRFRNTVQITSQGWAIHTSLLPVRVFDELKPHLKSDDLLYVLSACKPYTGYGPRKVSEWLSDYLETRREMG
jgi:hypothetical protein